MNIIQQPLPPTQQPLPPTQQPPTPTQTGIPVAPNATGALSPAAQSALAKLAALKARTGGFQKLAKAPKRRS